MHISFLAEGSADEPFFAWVHLYDVHYPWHPHGEGAEAGTYDGLHALLGGGVAAIKKCKGIGQKKAEVIDAVYRGLGGRRALESAARAYIQRKRREQLIKTILVVVGVVAALIWYATR